MDWQGFRMVSALSLIQERLGDHLLGRLQKGDRFRQLLSLFPTVRSYENSAGSPVGKELNLFFVALFNRLAFLRRFHLELPKVKVK